MVPGGGFEPPTRGFSILLYRFSLILIEEHMVLFLLPFINFIEIFQNMGYTQIPQKSQKAFDG